MIAARARRGRRRLALTAVLLAALGLRLWGVSFGLPALYDPDEATFILASLRMIAGHTLNPGWFGHPGSTTIYALALIDLLVFALARLAGLVDSAAAFADAAHFDPTIIFLPGRLFVVACAIGVVGLTYALGRRLFGGRTALVAALLVALSPLHVQVSQHIRTDVHASLFIMGALLASLEILRRGRLRAYAATGLLIGLGCATKWPAVTVAIAPAACCLARVRMRPAACGRELRGLGAAAAATVAGLVLGSPYLLPSLATLSGNLAAERRAEHLGATGTGPIENALWYAANALPSAFGPVGLLLVLGGIVLAARDSRASRATILPASLLFFTGICAQALVWERWLVPILPCLALFGAYALVRFCAAVARHARLRRHHVLAAGMLTVLVPMALTVRANAAERLHDTRRLASSWARANVPPGSTVTLEFLAFDLIREPWTFLVPGGQDGCIDAVRTLSGDMDRLDNAEWRGGRSILNLGTIASDRLDTCRGDYIFVVDYDRYLAEAARYPLELARYRALLRGSRAVATFRPIPGRTGGPTVRVFRPADLSRPRLEQR